MTSSPPLPPPDDAVWQSRRTPHRFFVELSRRFGDVVPYRGAPHPAFLVNHPDHLRHVLVTHPARYRKDTLAYQVGVTRQLFGQGLVTSEGAPWRRQRRLVQAAFHRARIAALCPLIARTAAGAFDALAGHAARGEPVDLAAEIAPLMLGITGQALFGVDLRDRAGAIGEAFAAVLSAIPPRPPPGDPDEVTRAMARLDALAHGLIRHRRAAPDGHDDLLASLLAARDPDTGAGLSDRELRDEIMTLLLGGYENSAHALAWTVHLLASHPDAQAAARAEVDRADGSEPADLVERLPYLGRVVAEAMRLFPPVWAFGRKASVDDEIGGVAIPAGASVTISPYAMHRHPAFWPDPDAFDPDRFLPGPGAARPRLAYLPFGAGERVCVGLPLAEPEALLVLAALLRRHELRPVPGHVVEPDTLVTLRPAHGVRVTLRARG